MLFRSIPPEQVIGSEGKLQFEIRDGKPVIMKLPALDFFDDNVFKPVAIQSHIGRRPIAAFGTSDGDLQMLQWAAAGSGPLFLLLVRHTDPSAERRVGKAGVTKLCISDWRSDGCSSDLSRPNRLSAARANFSSKLGTANR